MRDLTDIYNRETAAGHVGPDLERFETRDEDLEYQNVAAAENRDDAVREATFAIRESVRIGQGPGDIYDDEGNTVLCLAVLERSQRAERRNQHPRTVRGVTSCPPCSLWWSVTR